jgi:hypothetical protein
MDPKLGETILVLAGQERNIKSVAVEMNNINLKTHKTSFLIKKL